MTKPIRTLIEFIRESESVGPFSFLTLFRGQAGAQPLLPGVARKNPRDDTTAKERQVLKQLELQGASLLKDVGPTDLDRLVAAQHFGLKTRLLDWTGNPLAALWFACADPEKGDAYVYALEADELLEEDVYEKDPFSLGKTRVIQPRLNNPRIIAQNGWFTLHRYSKKAHSFVPLNKQREVSKFLHEIRIHEDARKSMLHSLHRHGVGWNSVFPDLIGLSRHLNWKHQLI